MDGWEMEIDMMKMEGDDDDGDGGYIPTGTGAEHKQTQKQTQAQARQKVKIGEMTIREEGRGVCMSVVFEDLGELREEGGEEKGDEKYIYIELN